MRYQAVSHLELPKGCHEQRSSGAADLVDPRPGRHQRWPAASAASLLSFAAAPIFLLMALLTKFGGGPLDGFCSAANASPLGGMVPMYLLMSAFHLAPWLKLISARMRMSEVGQSRA